MWRTWIIMLVAIASVASSGCAQGAGSPPAGSADRSTAPGGGTEQIEVQEETTTDGALGCSDGMIVSGFTDYAPGARGDKTSPVDLARRDFADRIKDGDTVKVSQRSRFRNTATVQVVRKGRAVATIEYSRVGGGWLRDYYQACSSF